MDPFVHLNLLGSSTAMKAVRRQIEKIATVDVPVMVLGETGTGKELAVRAVHYLSERRQAPFVPVNCGALPETLVESELFGHERGAFTDAKLESRGLIGEAEGGTLFLDEVDALGLRAQAALLRFLQDGTYRRVGGAKTRCANVRIVVATNANLAELVEARQFRRDLLYRLDVVTLRIPPLRERGDDVVELALAFVERLRVRYARAEMRLPQESIAHLRSHRWPGNVRELENAVHRAFVLAEDDFVRLGLPKDDLAGLARAGGEDESRPRSFKHEKAAAIASFEADYIRRLLAESNGNLSQAARLAGEERSAFGKLVRKHGLARDRTT
ncbi:sigma-54 dependent transcriptional regulator [Trinickia caryophylli]|uniref:Sigma-54 interaction domain-containing protein n=1 Tax=Trinickia caryophylli TaxID=28094 RepID=A0A1X7D6L3_TRICW|nr:sigma-54 dependent transcriptional regulator [Trinickia caryophylli]PMS12707.1 sigma-54-dependent Fis family transcriptional regulator [Trinickia caryophylli]TRX15112.1 sigma-54-dependent Fis family transcriptional regulator [Trinickia caryophylli]WQE14973.1 sigma-54 dependent transcriptional regulator [Trinickia caryophylli]SMF09324.1 Sigma-54 interaction domain-containing protein [Trinickia caryophylli]